MSARTRGFSRFFRRREDDFTRSYDEYLAQLDRRDEEARRKQSAAASAQEAATVPRSVPKTITEELPKDPPTELQQPVSVARKQPSSTGESPSSIYDDHHTEISQLEIMIDEAKADAESLPSRQHTTTPDLASVDPEQFLSETSAYLHDSLQISPMASVEPSSPIESVHSRQPSPSPSLRLSGPPSPISPTKPTSKDLSTRRLTPLAPSNKHNSASGSHKTPGAESTTPALDDVYTPHTSGSGSGSDTPASDVSPVFSIQHDNRSSSSSRSSGGGLALPPPKQPVLQPKPSRLFDAIYNRPIAEPKTKWLEQSTAETLTSAKTETTITSEPKTIQSRPHHSPPSIKSSPKKVQRRKPPADTTTTTTITKTAKKPLTPRQQQKIDAQREALYAISSKKHTARVAPMSRLKIQLPPKKKQPAVRQWSFELCTINADDDNHSMSYENFMKLSHKYSH
ncbi:hypothetical protein DIURU_001007 [Diutina rugosa]|uniref:Uncharacterized protein n=1 Tax=Diutina rugosa TaxID=5481 RepID=A0A642V2K9_DIURU|nr:uncharacterized protein DIURU_001007 [Diutina rugosa]KAA8906598.1 hypothetical protein DIURU_001007 [Diutina rugosa]